jgi:hypothetical protein
LLCSERASRERHRALVCVRSHPWCGNHHMVAC